MLARSLNGTDRKSAAQRSRDLFTAIAGGAERGRDVSLARLPQERDAAEPAAQAVAEEPLKAAATGAETTAARIRRLQAEAQSLAREEVAQLERRIAELAQTARQIAEGGDAYPVGAREVARRLAEELPRQGGVLEALLRKL